MVWGTLPQTFFTILKDTLDVILARFEGLRIERQVPCICHLQTDKTSCEQQFIYEDLADWLADGMADIPCYKSRKKASVPQMLYGIHLSTVPTINEEMQAGFEKVLAGQREIVDELTDELQQLRTESCLKSELLLRELTKQWNFELSKLNIPCPNSFIVMPDSADGLVATLTPQNWLSQRYRLYLLCQHPSGVHLVGKGYELREAHAFFKQISPWLSRLLKFLQYGIPGAKMAGLADEMVEQLQHGHDTLTKINSFLPPLDEIDTLGKFGARSRMGEEYELLGPALRALNHFLEEADPAKQWPLHRTPTPEGNLLWLCDTHYEPFRPKILQLPE